MTMEPITAANHNEKFFVPSGWKVEEHVSNHPDSSHCPKIKLYLVPEQQDMGRISGHVLRAALAGTACYNAELLEYLLEHQEYIPNELKPYYVFFWGTIFCAPDGSLYVSGLSWATATEERQFRGTWERYFHNLDYLFGSAFPAAVPLAA